MRCDEVRTMQGPYLDSELDAKTTLEIEQHLAGCSACAHLFAHEQKLQAQLTASLNRGSRTVALWTQIEREVANASSTSSPQQATRVPQPVGWPAVLRAFRAQFRVGWQTSRCAWTGLTAVWAVILVLNLAAREPAAPLLAGQEVPSVSELRLALAQKHMLMAELALTPEPAPANKAKPAPPSPHSERRHNTLNT
ncbi:MAG: zf-HC2 domain-containing protein [Verrucomicrobia bacterium]|nr:zf-HC2 domain-containing protein [Verrucomicrobiota bacterium]